MRIEDLEVYLVGGAVRDKLLGLPVKDRDWVVVGSNVDEMLALGFIPVGADFPVFIHPHSGEEYALARTERKTARGYHGFVFNASPEVTLEQDLQRRDLTINAMAMDPNGKIIDPYHGQQDLNARRLRHVSQSFVEDPVRVLRVARFMSRYADDDFRVADETMALMHDMVDCGELDALVAERVWRELESALAEPASAYFFKVLYDCRALAVALPGMHVNEDVIAQFDTILPRFNQSEHSALLKFCALFYVTKMQVEPFCRQLRAPNNYRKTAEKLNALLPTYTSILQGDVDDLCRLMQALDVPRNQTSLTLFLEYGANIFTHLNNHKIVDRATIIADALRQLDVGAALSNQPKQNDIAKQVLQIKKDCIANALNKA